MGKSLTDTQWKLVHKAVYAYRDGNTSLVAGVTSRANAKYLCAEFGFDFTRTDLGNENSYHWIDIDSLGTDENRLYVEYSQLEPTQFGIGYYLKNDNSIIVYKDYKWLMGKGVKRGTELDGDKIPMLKIERKSVGGVIIDTQHEVFRDYNFAGFIGKDDFVWKGSSAPFDLCDKLGCVPPRRYSYRVENPDQNYLHIPNYFKDHNPEEYLRDKGII